jgi:hypothetical protein
MAQWQISFPINGLHDVIKEPSSELTIDNKTKFCYRGNECVGTVIVDGGRQEEALDQGKHLIDKSLAKICFSYNTEASIDISGSYVKDLSIANSLERLSKSIVLRWSHRKEDPQTTLSNIASIKAADKKEVLDLALAYYKISEYANPLRIEALFSCMTVLARDLGYKRSDGYVNTCNLKKSIKDVLHQRTSNFDETQFDQDWRSFYSDERCNISHGKGSKLINIRTLGEHKKIVDTVGGWAREMIYYFIDRYKT